MSSEISLVDGDYEWSPLFHPVDLSLVRITVPASLLSMAAKEVMKHYTIVEDAAANISTIDNLQSRLVLIALVNKHMPFRYAEDLFRVWKKPVVSLKRIYMSCFDNPELIGNESQETICLKGGDVAVRRIISLIRRRVISINIQNTRAVSLLDLTGFPVSLKKLKRLMAASFTPMERMTVVVDLVVPRGENEIGDEWIELLCKINTTFILRIHSLHMEGLNKVTMMRLLEVSVSSNRRLQGVRMASMDCNDWTETMRAVSSLESCQHLVSLGLNDKVFQFTANTQDHRSKCINTALVNLPCLERLDLSYNVMSGALKGILLCLRLTYLDVSKCGLVFEDLRMILSLSSLIHLNISRNSGVGDLLGSLVSAVQDTRLPSLEILKMVICGVNSTNEQNLLKFVNLFPLVQVLDVRSNDLNPSAVVLLIRKRIDVLLVASPCECSCGGPRSHGLIKCGGRLYCQEEVDRVLKEENYVKSRFIMNHFMIFKVTRLGGQT